MILAPRDVEIRHGHMFCGSGGGAKGFNRGAARVGYLRARMRCLGGIDRDQAAVRDFERAAGVRGTVLDLFDYEQYCAFHGHEPPPGWRAAVPDDIRAAFQWEHPHLLFLSAPCKGFSGLLSEKNSKSAKYQALNALTLRGMWLVLEAFKDDPIELIAFENVPRIRTRGRALLDRIEAMFRAYGYAVAESEHDCGELGGMAQRRVRFLLMLRHIEKVPPFLYEPPKRPLRGVGEILSKLPVPGRDAVLPMHKLPLLHWQTWVRLAFVEAGSDWRSLNKLRVADGVLQDYALVPDREWYRGALGVTGWDEPAGTVTSEARPQNGKFSVADPRFGERRFNYHDLGVKQWGEPSAAVSGQSAPGGGRYAVADPRPIGWDQSRASLGVRSWQQPAPTIINVRAPGQGPFSVADPRYDTFGEHAGKMRVEAWAEPAHTVTGSDRVGSGALSIADPRIGGAPRFNHVYRIVPWSETAPAIAGGGGPAGGLSVADPRTGFGHGTHNNILSVTPWRDPSRTVTSGDHPSGGGLCVADPRPAYARDRRSAYHTAGEYGVVPWDAQSGAVTSSGQHDNGRWSVADPRQPDLVPPAALPAPTDRLVAVIQALDGTYHRPFTTLELAFIQSFFDVDDIYPLDGRSDAAWRERIGNMVPPDAAEAMASVMAQTLLLAWTGETFMLSATPIWVRPFAVALSVKPEAIA